MARGTHHVHRPTREHTEPVEEPVEAAPAVEAPEPTTQPLGVIKHTTADQQAGGGYPRSQLVLHDGAIWRSVLPNNLYHPGGNKGWEFYG